MTSVPGLDALYAVAYVQLAGADSAMVNLLAGIDLDNTEVAAEQVENWNAS
jgi:hypothetical protein